MLVIAHLSDLHLDGTETRRRKAVRVKEYLDKLTRPVDVILLSGDIVDDGTEAGYAAVAELFDGPAPVLALPGNHDLRGPLSASMLEGRGTVPGKPLHWAETVRGVLFVLLDTTVPGEDGGRLDADGIAWLEGTLADAAPGTPVLLVMHHPPVVLGHPFVDSIRLADSDGLAATVRAHPEIVALLAGHAHTAAAATFAGVPLLVAPGVSSTMLLPWEPNPGTHPVLDLDAPPGFAYHQLDDENRLTTHFRLLP